MPVILALLLVLSSFNLHGQGNAKVSEESIKKELLLIKETLEESQPYLYRYISKDDFENSYNDIFESVDDSLSQLEVYKLFSPFVNQIKNGHTKLKPPKAYLETAKVLPLKLIELDNRIFVEHDFSSSGGLESFELQEINGVPIAEIVREITPFVSIDGFSDTVRMKLSIEKDFAYYYHTVIDQPESFNIQCLNNQNGQIVTRQLSSITYSAFEDRVDNIASEPWDVKFIKHINTAVLTIVSLRDYDEFNFSKFLKQTFSELEKNQTENLILDIRNNRGGDLENTVELLEYLILEPIQVSKKIEIKMINPPTHAQYTNYEQLYWSHFFNEKTVVKDGEYYRMTDHFSLDETEPNKKNFTGNLYILMNATTGSAAGTLVSILKSTDRGLVIGEENRANYSGYSAGSSLIITLPYSRNQVYVALIGYTNVNSKDTGRGVIPDYRVNGDWQHYFNDKDLELNFVIDLIKTTKK